MKGMVFTMLEELVETEFGIETWDALIEVTQPASGGIYTSVETYPDEELLAYVAALSERLNVPAGDLVFAFGKFLLKQFAASHPEVFEGHTAKSFLKSVDQQIHVEVRKLHPGVVLPEFKYEDKGDDELLMRYFSPRKLCRLAEGLIAGTSEHFEVPISVEHSVCMQLGADYCDLQLRFGQKNAVAAA